jgi:glutamate---cysteine ligase / carboxylate-amine ligase
MKYVAPRSRGAEVSRSRHWWRRVTELFFGAGGADEGAGRLPQTPAAIEARFREGFLGADVHSVGIEEELILVDPVTFEAEEACDWVLRQLPARPFLPELRSAQIELALPPRATIAALGADLRDARARLVEALGGELRVIASGGHPTLAHGVSAADRPRYLAIAREYSWAMRRGLPSGFHVHVAIADADEALAVYNAARSYLPELAALGANSPFFEGADSGLASSRLKLTEDLPRAGIPPAFASWRELAEFVSWGVSGGLFADLSYLWWDLRLRPEYGTIEFRITDTQTSLEDSAGIAAFCQSLVAALREQVRAGASPAVHPVHVLAENRWRALRDGLDAELVDPASGLVERARDRVTRLLLELEPQATRIGCGPELAKVWPLLAANGAERQRAVAGERGLDGLLEWLADQTELASGAHTRQLQGTVDSLSASGDPGSEHHFG